jgi:cell division protein ZapA
MDSSERVSVKISIGDRSYPLRVPIEDQQKIQRAAALINEKVGAYKGKYSNKDMQDFIAMAALQLATQTLEQEATENSSLIEDILSLNKKLDSYLSTSE